MTLHENFVGGRFVPVTGGDRIDVLNPARDNMISQIPDTDAQGVADAVAVAKKAQVAWEKLPPIQRAGFLRQISAKIRANADEIARVISEEQGKMLPLATVEVHFTADYIDYMAEWARRIEGEIIPADRPNENIFLFRQPLGVVAGILPWNFPFFLIARKMAPALITGNTIVIKPSEETPNNAFEFARLVTETDLPQGVFNLVYGRGATTGKALTTHEDVGMISFTGSVETGSRIMAAAAKNITKLNLELGGKAPAIVTADADLDLAASAITQSRMLNTGQVCNGAERVYVDRSGRRRIHRQAGRGDEGRALWRSAGRGRTGHGPDDQPRGPGQDRRAGEIGRVGWRRGRAWAARPLIWGRASTMSRRCWSTVARTWRSSRRKSSVRCCRIQVSDLDEAIDLANDTTFGLTSSIYTTRLNDAMRACQELKFGETYVNRENFEAMQGFHAGRGKSGIGGADGKHGLLEYTETHIAYIQT